MYKVKYDLSFSNCPNDPHCFPGNFGCLGLSGFFYRLTKNNNANKINVAFGFIKNTRDQSGFKIKKVKMGDSFFISNTEFVRDERNLANFLHESNNTINPFYFNFGIYKMVCLDCLK